MFPHTVPVRFWNDLLYSMTLASVLVMTFLGEASTNWGLHDGGLHRCGHPGHGDLRVFAAVLHPGFHRRCEDKANFPGSVSPNCSVSAASSTFGIRMERAESESVYFSIPADFRQTAETPYVRCFRCLCIHLPRLPVLDGSSCPGSRFTAHTPRLPTSIFVHCNIKTLYYQLLGYHTNNI